jgi:hypothetical protein
VDQERKEDQILIVSGLFPVHEVIHPPAHAWSNIPATSLDYNLKSFLPEFRTKGICLLTVFERIEMDHSPAFHARCNHFKD